MARANYICVGSNDLPRALAFYDALLGAFGMTKMFDHPSGGRLYRGGESIFAVLGPYDGKPATVGNGSMAGFGLDSGEEVARFHAKAIELGAINEGDPSERGPGITFGYFRDLDGNKVAGYHFG